MGLAGLLWAATIAAQLPSSDVPPHVAIVEGDARLERSGHVGTLASNMPVIPGDRLTTPHARVEILLPDAAVMHVDRLATLELTTGGRGWWLESGTIVVSLAEDIPTRDSLGAVVSSPFGVIPLVEPGRYAVTVTGRELKLAVWSGAAELVAAGGSVRVHAGELAFAEADGRPSGPFPLDQGMHTDLLRWVEARSRDRFTTHIWPYVPGELQVYGATLDRHGTWQRHPQHGVVWYPSVDASWLPYSDGRWINLAGYGTTWVGTTAWSWPTHHHGRWGATTGSAWFWVPETTWSPAQVTWAVAPGLIAWRPLRLDGRGAGTRSPPGADLFLANGAYDPWPGWTVVDREAFAFDAPVASAAVSPDAIRPDRRTLFVSQRVAPLPRRVGAHRTLRIVGQRADRRPVRRAQARDADTGRAPVPMASGRAPAQFPTPNVTPRTTRSAASARRGGGLPVQSRPLTRRPAAAGRPSSGPMNARARARPAAAPKAAAGRSRPASSRATAGAAPASRAVGVDPARATPSTGDVHTRPATKGLPGPRTRTAVGAIGGRSRVRSPATGRRATRRDN